MTTTFAVAAAVACALCNAVAAVLQKSGSDKVEAIRSYNLGVVTKLFRQVPYVAGLGLDLAAGVFTLMAVTRLPIFLVQSIIASCVLITAFLERWFLGRRLGRAVYIAGGVVVLGLACMAVAAQPESTASASPTVIFWLMALPYVLAAAGAVAIRMKSPASGSMLALVGGAAFGMISVIGRLLMYPHPLWLFLANPLVWTIAVYGGVGMYLFTAALQRAHATGTNGLMIASQTLVPTLIGIVYLGDTVRSGLWVLVWLGCALVTVGCSIIARKN